MKKPVRTLIASSVAAILGALLLVGGAGSLAFWSDETTTVSAPITSGKLELGSIEAPKIAWQISQRATGFEETAKKSFTPTPIVPGDVLTGTVPVPVTLVGENMKARLSLTLTASPSTTAPADIELAKLVNSNANLKVLSVDGHAGANGLISPKLGSDKRDVNVIIEMAFPWESTLMGGSVVLNGTYTLTQVPLGASS